MAAVISLYNIKGGVGKTTTAASLAAFFAAKGVRVLAVDMCRCGALVGYFVDKPLFDNSFAAIMNGEHLPVFACREHLHVCRCFVEDEAFRKVDDYKAMDGFFRMFDELCRDYDLVVTDIPGDRSPLSLAALTVSDRILVPLKADRMNMSAIESVMFFLDTFGLRGRADLFFTMHDVRERNSVAAEGEARALYGASVMETSVRRNVSLCEAPAHFQDIFAYRPKSSGAADYAALADELYGRMTSNDNL